MQKLLKILFIGLSCAMLLSGCSVIHNKQREIDLDNTLKLYQKAWRWGEFETILALHKQKPEPPDMSLLTRLKELKITRYVETKRYSPSPTELYQIAEIYYYLQPGVTEQHQTHNQLWRYDETAERWYIDGDLPALLH